MTKYARYYRPDKNPDGATFPGVPLENLTEEEFTSYPSWLQASIDASEFYQKTAPPKAVRAASADASEAEAEPEPSTEE